MKFSKFIFIPVIIASLALTIQIVDQVLSPMMPVEGNSGFGWIAFIAWATYFMAGCTLEGGKKTFFGYVAGIAASIAIIELGSGVFSSLGFLAFPVAVFFTVIPCICLERIPPFDFVPALFVGSGTFFGFLTYIDGATYTTTIITELTYCVIGLVYGVVTVALRTRYEAMVEEQDEGAEDLHASH